MIKDETVAVKTEETATTAAAGGFDPMEEDPHIWLDGEEENLLDVTDASIFYNDFPPLPDFPCMSSSSSSSSTPPPPRPAGVTSSSSSAVSSSPPDSWASLMKSDADNEIKPEPTALSSTASMEIPPPPPPHDLDCLNVMETFGYMDLIDSNEIWDPSSVFQSDSLNPQDFFDPPPPPESHSFSSFLQENSELAMIFFEWLKQNKDYISAEDMRSIKLKRATIESASKRLGNDKEGKKQLLKLILEWVEQHQLQKKKMTMTCPSTTDPNTEPNFNYPDPNPCFWAPPPPPQPFPSYGCGDPYANQMPMVPMMPYQAVMDHNAPPGTWPMPSPYPMPQYAAPYPDAGCGMLTQQQAFYPYSGFDSNGERLMRLGSSATKEARKKRMARQRRMYSHHHRHVSSSGQHQSQSNDDANAGGGDGGEVDGDPDSWVYWSGGGGGGASSPTANGNAPPGDAPQSGERAPSTQKASSDRRPQGCKSEKNLKFLLQKVLKQSDVGNLGRIVLPKKEAESHLPELETRDGISIAMEDIGTSRVWNMRYRFWPNNKSRMYLLENTGDFVRVNGLQEGDFIVIYSDTKCGKFMIRGVKVRQPGGKLEGKKPARRNIRNLSLGGNSSSLTPIKQAVR